MWSRQAICFDCLFHCHQHSVAVFVCRMSPCQPFEFPRACMFARHLFGLFGRQMWSKRPFEFLDALTASRLSFRMNVFTALVWIFAFMYEYTCLHSQPFEFSHVCSHSAGVDFRIHTCLPVAVVRSFACLHSQPFEFSPLFQSNAFFFVCLGRP